MHTLETLRAQYAELSTIENPHPWIKDALLTVQSRIERAEEQQYMDTLASIPTVYLLDELSSRAYECIESGTSAKQL